MTLAVSWHCDFISIKSRTSVRYDLEADGNKSGQIGNYVGGPQRLTLLGISSPNADNIRVRHTTIESLNILNIDTLGEGNSCVERRARCYERDDVWASDVD